MDRTFFNWRHFDSNVGGPGNPIGVQFYVAGPDGIFYPFLREMGLNKIADVTPGHSGYTSFAVPEKSICNANNYPTLESAPWSVSDFSPADGESTHNVFEVSMEVSVNGKTDKDSTTVSIIVRNPEAQVNIVNFYANPHVS